VELRDFVQVEIVGYDLAPVQLWPSSTIFMSTSRRRKSSSSNFQGYLRHLCRRVATVQTATAAISLQAKSAESAPFGGSRSTKCGIAKPPWMKARLCDVGDVVRQ
jgi:hypothetical protein